MNLVNLIMYWFDNQVLLIKGTANCIQTVLITLTIIELVTALVN